MSKFIAYGDNVMCEVIKTIGETVYGKVVNSTNQGLPDGTIVLYGEYDSNQMEIAKDIKRDIIWRPKIRAILVED